MAIIDKLRELVEPLCADLGIEIYDLELNGGVFRVSVDRDGGIGMTDIAELTRSISRALDVHDPISGHYTLEVSSPGLERPLRTPEHYRRAVGSPVKLKLVPGAVAGRRLEGLLVAADDTACTLRLSGGAEQQLAYDLIDKARTVFEWGPTPRPSDAAKAKAKPAAPTKTKKQPSGAPGTATVRPASDDAGKVVNA
jgi:ribosome maturation factor RimP